ncbi:MAG: UDP-N-acetylmuramate dehydrogenase [Minisyncoccia bacterium]
MRVEEHIPLGALTTFGIGGPARFFAHVKDIRDLSEAVAFAQAKGAPLFILGGGSNVLIADKGFSGLVVKVEMRGVAVEMNPEETPSKAKESPRDSAAHDPVLLIASAGEPWDALVLNAVHENLWGIENLSGIPGTVGGAVVQNIGAYGAAISEALEWVEAYDIASGAITRLKNAECAFGYRDSIFKHRPQLIVVRTALRLSISPRPNLSYRDLAARFDASTPALADIRDAVIDIRAGKFPDLTREGTAGSFFKNPMLPLEEAEKLRARYAEMPLFSMPETPLLKVPLAWLLDHALNLTGARVGGARLYERQPLVIAAARGTSAADVIALAEMVRTRVREQCGFEIKEEVRVIA